MSVEDYKLSRPLRSELYSLPPIGIGTPQVESLESYTCRLAAAHEIPRRKLEQFVNHRGPTIYLDASGPPRLDSPSEIAAAFAKRLAEATRQPMVEALGLGRFAGKIAVLSTLRRHRSWCPDCFRDARANAQATHLPLLWSLSSYKICIAHQRALQTSCGTCGRRSDLSRSLGRALDRCPSCDADLAVQQLSEGCEPKMNDGQGPQEVEMFLGRVLGKFIAQASASTAPIGCPDFSRVVPSVIDRGIARTAKELCRRGGISPSTLTQIKVQGKRLGMAALLRVTAAADVSMMGIFDAAQWCEGEFGTLPSRSSELPRIKYNKGKHDWERIRREVCAELERGGAPSFRSIARRTGADEAHLGQMIRDLRDLMKERQRVRRQQERKRRLQDLVNRVRPVREAIVRAGMRPSARGISIAMGVPGRSPYLVAAIKIVNAEA